MSFEPFHDPVFGETTDPGARLRQEEPASMAKLAVSVGFIGIVVSIVLAGLWAIPPYIGGGFTAAAVIAVVALAAFGRWKLGQATAVIDRLP